MRVIQNFHYTGNEQRWTVPEGIIGDPYFEAWGAAGGMGSGVCWAGAKNVLHGGSAPTNQWFTNNPSVETQLGYSYANNAGYAAGSISVTEGEVFYVYVGGNGRPGYSAIKKTASGYASGFRGGAGGFNGGGDGGKGALVFRNLYNSTSTAVKFSQAGVPNGPASVGDLWYDTDDHVVRRCITAYTAGNGTLAKYTTKSDDHTYVSGPSGGGGGGATDFRRNGNGLSNRVLVAGGSGGSGGGWNRTQGAPSGWQLVACPTTPNPPFGTDDKGSGPTDKVNHVWNSSVNLLTGGWGRGGLGGSASTGNSGSPTTNGGVATTAGAGGPATGRHATSGGARYQPGSAGTGATATTAGLKGVGGTGASNGSAGQGGDGATAAGGFDDMCAGGGGGGGGYYGGGGGGEGFLNFGASAKTGATSHGGGGGAGNNYADQVVDNPVLIGGARPPSSAPGYKTGGNGYGGFARITYRLAPGVAWTDIPTSYEAGAAFDATFEFTPAVESGVGIAYYVVGTNSTITASSPSVTTTINVTDETLTSFTRSFTAPADGVSEAFYVKVVDTDGDASDWIKHIVVGASTSTTTGVTITSPTAGATFIDTASVTWTAGTQSPIAAIRGTITGNDINTGDAVTVFASGWRRGGSRANLATDPGFISGGVWSSDLNTSLTANQADFPGVSGKNGRIAWVDETDELAENHTTTWDNLIVGAAYRLHLGLASDDDNDARVYTLTAWDNTGPLDSVTIDTSAVLGGVYVYTDFVFTPRAQGVYFVLQPSDTSGIIGNSDGTTVGQIAYLSDMLLELVYEDDGAAYPAYFDGSHLNGLTGAVSWSGTANASASILTGTDVVTTDVAYTGDPIANGLISIVTIEVNALIDGFAGIASTVTANVNPSVPETPVVSLTISSATGLMTLDIDANDGAATTKTTSFDIFRNGTRIVTGLLPDPTTRLATYDDTPGHGETVTYVVRAWDEAGGYADQDDGTVSGS